MREAAQIKQVVIKPGFLPDNIHHLGAAIADTKLDSPGEMVVLPAVEAALMEQGAELSRTQRAPGISHRNEFLP